MKTDKKKKCFICCKIIKDNCITYLPYKHNLCSNDCLIKYRKRL